MRFVRHQWRSESARLLCSAAVACALLASAQGCGGRSSPSEPAADSPAWVQKLITQLESQPVTNPPSAILRYRYRNATAYFRPSRCCDIPGDLYDERGAVFCHPDGGFTGQGDGRCADFFSARTEERLIWQDTRPYPAGG